METAKPGASFFLFSLVSFSEEGLNSPFAWLAGMSFRVTGRWIPVAQVRNNESQDAGPGAGCISPWPFSAAQAALRPFLWDLLFLDRSGKQDSADSLQVRSEEEGAARTCWAAVGRPSNQPTVNWSKPRLLFSSSPSLRSGEGLPAL